MVCGLLFAVCSLLLAACCLRCRTAALHLLPPCFWILRLRHRSGGAHVSAMGGLRCDGVCDGVCACMHSATGGVWGGLPRHSGHFTWITECESGQVLTSFARRSNARNLCMCTARVESAGVQWYGVISLSLCNGRVISLSL